MEINIAPGIDIDPQTILTGRCCIIGQSGSGKSYLAGVIIEELCRTGLPFAIVDTEGEYASLKSAFKIVLIGRDNADLDLDVDLAKLFRSSIEGNVPLVFDLSEVVDKEAYVDKLLTTLYGIEDKMRSPYLLIIEEADKFAPQVVRKERNPVEEISVRGRKRGLGLLVATQRPANISKNVLAQCSYGFIGKLTTENDIHAVDILFEDKKRLFDIPKLGTGEFLAFGLGKDDPFHVKQRTVLHSGSTPRISGVEAAGDPREIIAMMKGKQPAKRKQSASEAAKAAEATTEVDVLRGAVTEEWAEAYAARIAQKQFLLFGNAVESVDEIARNYIPLVSCRIRIPTYKNGVYEERHIMLDGKFRAVRIDKKINAGWFGGEKRIKLSADEGKVLRVLNSASWLTVEKAMKQTGLDDMHASRSLLRLERAGLAKRNKDRFSSYGLRAMLEEAEPDISEEKVPEGSIIGNPDTLLKSAKERILTLFPGSQFIGIGLVYLPFYRITLRKGSRVKVVSVDAITGKPLEAIQDLALSQDLESKP